MKTQHPKTILDKKPRSKTWPLSKIYLKDCIKFLKNTDYFFSVIIADPPYNIGKDFGNNKSDSLVTEYTDWSREWIDLCLERLTNEGLLYIYGFSEILSHIAVQYPIEKQKWLVWHYTNKTVPSFQFWQRSHESILCLWKDKRPPLELNQIREPYTKAYQNCIGKVRKSTKGRFGNQETIYKGHKKGALPRDVLKIPALAGGKGKKERSSLKHPTQKPFELSRKLLQSRINNKNKIAYIPFCGSGSECLVAQALNIPFIATEINPLYATEARKWLKNKKFINNLRKSFKKN